MKITKLELLSVLTLLGALPIWAQGNSKLPHIGYLFPSGAQQGTSCEITVGGQYFSTATDVLVSGSGVELTLARVQKVISKKRIGELREYVTEARKNFKTTDQNPKFDKPENIATALRDAGATEDEIKGFFEEANRYMDPKRQPNVQIAEKAVLKAVVAADAAAGPREVRVKSSWGISNPLTFFVGNLPEIQGGVPTRAGSAVTIDKAVELPAIINGQILPGESDRYCFAATRGQHLVVAVQARDLIPFLADAVPGWFQPVAVLYQKQASDGKEGKAPPLKEVAFSKDYRYSPDPVFCCEIPESGSYLLEIRDALYRGREDFVYRITMGEVPFVTGVFPLGGRVGKPTSVSVAGWNLGARARVGPITAGSEGVRAIPELSNGRAIGEMVFATDTLPEVTEQSSKSPQRVKPPVIVNGRIGAPGEIDAFTFHCAKGENVVVEVQARRLNSPLDSWLKVTDDEGRQIAFNDDWQNQPGGYLTHKADSFLSFKAPAAGDYRVALGDSQKNGGPDFSYRLRISPPMPSFALRFVPSCVNGLPGYSVPVTLYALRKDGFSGDIACALKDGPPGFFLDGGLIQQGQDKARATLTFPPDFLEKPVTLSVEGKGTAPGADREECQLATPAEDMLQAFMYHHLVPTSALLAATTGKGHRTPPFRPSTSQPVDLPVGGIGKVTIVQKWAPWKKPEDYRFEISEPIPGITLENIAPGKGEVVLSFRTDPAIVKEGWAGNLILEQFNQWTQAAKDGKPMEKKKVSAGYLPAIPFRVVAKSDK